MGTTQGREQGRYTHGHHESVLRSHRWRTSANSASHLLPHLVPGMTLLDVGCGPGTLTMDLASMLAPGKVVGIDPAPIAVAEAMESAGVAGIDNVRFAVDDLASFARQGATFDVVHAHQVLQHLVDPVAALRAMGRLARPGGLVSARDSDYSAMAWAPTDSAMERWREIYLAVARHNSAEPDAGRWLSAWALQAGFTDVTYSTSTWTFALPDERRWWADLWAERTVASAFGEQAVAYGISNADELVRVAAGWRRWAEDPGAVFFVPHGEILARRSE